MLISPIVIRVGINETYELQAWLNNFLHSHDILAISNVIQTATPTEVITTFFLTEGKRNYHAVVFAFRLDESYKIESELRYFFKGISDIQSLYTLNVVTATELLVTVLYTFD